MSAVKVGYIICLHHYFDSGFVLSALSLIILFPKAKAEHVPSGLVHHPSLEVSLSFVMCYAI